MPEGVLETYEVDNNVRLPVLRGDIPTPCSDCPKKSPENGLRLEMKDWMWEAFNLWRRIQATNGAYELHPKLRTCQLFAECMAIVSDSVKQAEAAIKTRAYREADENRSQ